MHRSSYLDLRWPSRDFERDQDFQQLGLVAVRDYVRKEGVSTQSPQAGNPFPVHPGSPPPISGIPNPGGAARQGGPPGFGLVLLVGRANSRSDGDAVQPRRIARRIGIGDHDLVCSGIQLHRNHDRHRRIEGAAVYVQDGGRAVIDIDIKRA